LVALDSGGAAGKDVTSLLRGYPLLIPIAALLLATADPAATPPAAKPVDKNEVICWYEAPVGTHFKQKMCATRGQLDAQRRNAADYMSRTPMAGRSAQ
jgi:hypothetical protein